MSQTYCDKMKTEKFHSVGTVPKSNRKIVERGKIDTPKTYAGFDYGIFFLCKVKTMVSGLIIFFFFLKMLH
jgi:hypothetical protein